MDKTKCCSRLLITEIGTKAEMTELNEAQAVSLSGKERRGLREAGELHTLESRAETGLPARHGGEERSGPLTHSPVVCSMSVLAPEMGLNCYFHADSMGKGAALRLFELLFPCDGEGASFRDGADSFICCLFTGLLSCLWWHPWAIRAYRFYLVCGSRWT